MTAQSTGPPPATPSICRAVASKRPSVCAVATIMRDAVIGTIRQAALKRACLNRLRAGDVIRPVLDKPGAALPPQAGGNSLTCLIHATNSVEGKGLLMRKP